jgi:hypothetical protein
MTEAEYNELLVIDPRASKVMSTQGKALV